MSDDGIPARLAALDEQWEWITEATSRVDALANTFATLKSRHEAVKPDDVNREVLSLLETNEKVLPELEKKLEEAEDALEDHHEAFDKNATDLTKRIDGTKSVVG